MTKKHLIDTQMISFDHPGQFRGPWVAAVLDGARPPQKGIFAQVRYISVDISYST